MAAFTGTTRWMSTRIVYPLDMPISLAPGHVRTPPFRINLRTAYNIFITIPDSWQWDQAHPECNPYRHLQTRSVLYRDGKIVDRQDPPTTLPWATSFEVSAGTYELDVEVLNDFRCVDPIGPHLEIIARTEDYESGAFAVKVAAIVAVYVGLCLLVFLPAVRAVALRTIAQREARINVADSAAGQNYQWAQRLPLRPPISGLPGFGLVGGIFFALMAMMMMVLLAPTPQKGVWVHLLKPGTVPEKSDSWNEEPLIVWVKQGGLNEPPNLYLNSRQIAWQDLDRELKQALSRRRDWVAYIGGDDGVAYAQVATVIDAARGYHAKVVLITSDAILRN